MKHSSKTGNFLWLWILVTTVSSLVGILSGVLGGFIIALFIPPRTIGLLQINPTSALVGFLLGGALAGVIVGISQGLVLRKYFPRIRYWIGASIIYGTIGLGFVLQSRSIASRHYMTEKEIFWQSITAGLIVGTIAGILQWFALIAQFPQDSRWRKVSSIWVLVSPLSMAISFPLLYFGELLSLYVGGEFNNKILLFVGGLAIYASITGLALLWLLKQR